MFKRFFFRKPKRRSGEVWLSHHIPKTAGTSLRVAYEKAVGRAQVYKLYDPAKVHKFEAGEISFPGRKPFIIHGHYKPDPRQLAIESDVRRVVWLRDPVQRAWSLLRHLVDVKQFEREFELLKTQFGSKITNPDEEVLEFFLSNKEFSHLNRPYQNYFKTVGLEEFDFVGCMENFNEDLLRLADIMQIDLNVSKANVRNSKVIIKSVDFKQYLEKEYKAIRSVTHY